MTTRVSTSLTSSVQALIDSRLDTIDRMLMGRVARPERLAIVREVEAQIDELLQERGTDEPSREDVLAVLARLDPPEAYLPEEFTAERPVAPVPRPFRTAPANRPEGTPTGRVGGIVALSALSLVMLLPVVYLLAILLESDLVLFVSFPAISFLMFAGGLAGLILGIQARLRHAWSAVGVVVGALSLVLSLAMGVLMLVVVLSL